MGSLAERDAPAARSSQARSALAGSALPSAPTLSVKRTSSRPSWSWSEESTEKLRVSLGAAPAARNAISSGGSTLGETTTMARAGAREISGALHVALTSSVALRGPVWVSVGLCVQSGPLGTKPGNADSLRGAAPFGKYQSSPGGAFFSCGAGTSQATASGF